MSSDRLTELQNQLDVLSQMFYVCTGVIQRDAPPRPKPGLSTVEEIQQRDAFELQIKDMATHVSQAAKSVHDMIDLLPGVNSTETQQLNTLQQLEEQNGTTADELRRNIQQAGGFVYYYSDSCRSLVGKN